MVPMKRWLISGAVLILALAVFAFIRRDLFLSDTYNSTEYHTVHEVTLNGNQTEMDRLLDLNPKLLNVPDYDKNTLLHLAVLRNEIGEVKDLLARGAKVNAQNTARMTPMHLAAKQGEHEIVTLILTHHPDLALRDSRGWTPLTWAVRAHHDEAAQLLRDAGARE
jgi:ankyrin repeat protein